MTILNATKHPMLAVASTVINQLDSDLELSSRLAAAGFKEEMVENGKQLIEDIHQAQAARGEHRTSACAFSRERLDVWERLTDCFDSLRDQARVHLDGHAEICAKLGLYESLATRKEVLLNQILQFLGGLTPELEAKLSPADQEVSLFEELRRLMAEYRRLTGAWLEAVERDRAEALRQKQALDAVRGWLTLMKQAVSLAYAGESPPFHRLGFAALAKKPATQSADTEQIGVRAQRRVRAMKLTS